MTDDARELAAQAKREAEEAARSTRAAHARVKELREETHRLDKDQGERIAQLEDARRWKMAHVGTVATVLGMLGALLWFAFYTRSEGTKTEERLAAQASRLSTHIASQDLTNAELKKSLEKQDEKSDRILEGLSKIGARWGVKVEKPQQADEAGKEQ